MASSIVLNIPHASTYLPWMDIPSPYHEPSGAAYWAWGGKYVVRERILEKYKKELPYMTDWYVDELFINGVGRPLVAPISRLLCDMERFKDDMKEEMSTIGMGICYTTTHDLENLAFFKFSHKKYIIEKYYDPYHKALENYVREAQETHPHVLILDCHSFNNWAYECDKYHAACRPDICIGTDPEYTPEELINITVRYFEDLGYSVKLNYPYSGTMVPSGVSNEKLYSIMIELNRKLYLDWEGETVKKTSHFEVLKAQLYDYEKMLEAYMETEVNKTES